MEEVYTIKLQIIAKVANSKVIYKCYTNESTHPHIHNKHPSNIYKK